MRPNGRQKLCNCIPGAEKKRDGSCELCPPGTHFPGASSGHTKMCEDCDETSVQPMAGTMECIRCKYGTFPNPERTKCIRCPDGQVWIGRKRICGMFPADRYYDEYNLKCINCEPDTFKAAAGQGPCLPCSKNTHSPRGASECTECEEGLVLLRDGTCGKCKAGEYFVLVPNAARQGSTTIPLYRPGRSTRLMKILTWNISGACNKDEELEALIKETEADVCVLTEMCYNYRHYCD